MMSKPFVSVIIPVFNDAQRLQKCLGVLDKQSYPADLYEVIVVDNASTESIEEIVNQFKQTVATSESKPGSYAARNQGIALAKGEILAFTDSDCLPSSQWIEQGVEALLGEPKCDIVGGKIELFFRDPNNLTAVELYEKITAFPQQKHIEKNHFTPTANLFTFKSIFERAGNFNHNLKSNGDREWCQRCFQQGYQLKYAENALIMHPARYSLSQIYQRHLRIGGGRADAYREKYQNKTLFILKVIQEILGDFLAIPKEFIIVLLKKKYSVEEKIKIFSVLLLLKLALNGEKMRVMMGGVSRN